jgi:hypothetical protein
MTEIGFSEDFQSRLLDPEIAGIMGSMDLGQYLVGLSHPMDLR